MPMDLRAAPTRNNNGAFTPFDEDVYYYFDFTNVHGDWLRWGERWKFWTVHTGPNAWLANAALHYVLALRQQGASAQSAGTLHRARGKNWSCHAAPAG